jgi:hypothetical protein
LVATKDDINSQELLQALLKLSKNIENGLDQLKENKIKCFIKINKEKE